MDYEYREFKEGIRITKYNGSEKNIVIPKELYGRKVLVIGNSVFYNKGLTSVVIPDGVTSISDSAFCNNDLTEVKIPNSVTLIGSSAFSYNRLTEIVFPESVKFIGSSSFSGNKIKSVIIPDSVKELKWMAFGFNENFNDVYFHNSINPYFLNEHLTVTNVFSNVELKLENSDVQMTKVKDENEFKEIINLKNKFS